MATTKNITMKQFNGTDYDTLYPKTKVEQIENLTPSSIGAVNKSGDTMTGNLKVPTLDVAPDVSAGYIYGETNSLNIRGGNPNTGTMHYLGIKDSGVYVDNNLVCHEGNLQSIGGAVGVARITTGSYVGTGTRSFTINFAVNPKIVIIPGSYVRVFAYGGDSYLYGSGTFYTSLNVKWNNVSSVTLSATSDADTQYADRWENASGTTYTYYVIY